MKHAPTRLVAVGDIMLGRGIRQIDVVDATQLLVPDLLSRLTGDIVTGNLECLIGTAGAPNPLSHSNFQGDPDIARPMVELFDVVSMANNHVGDYGDDALAETLAWLAEIRVQNVGVGESVEEAIEPSIFEINEQKYAIFGATTVGCLPSSSRYTLAVPGRALYRRAASLVADGYRCILHLHAGGGDVCHPAPAIRMLMSEVRDAGFSIVLGHHPHVIQGCDRASNGTVFFSLGDFIFDKLEDDRDQALLVDIALGSQDKEDLIEVDIVQRAPDLSLFLLTGDARTAKLQRFEELSAMIRSQASDRHYLEWRGSKWRRLAQSLLFDFQARGWRAIGARLGRVNTRKLVDLLARR